MGELPGGEDKPAAGAGAGVCQRSGRKDVLPTGCRSLGEEESIVSWGNHTSYTD